MFRKMSIISIMVCCWLMSTVLSYGAQSDHIQIVLNGERLEGAHAIIKNGTTLVPFRVIFKTLGAKIDHNKETGETSAIFEDGSVSVWSGEDTVEFREELYLLPEPIQTIGGSIYIPSGFIKEALKYEVHYDKSNNQVSFTKIGFGQENAINQLLHHYLQIEPYQPLSDLFVPEYEGVKYEGAEPFISSVPLNTYEPWIGQIEYESGSVAKVSAGYAYETSIYNEAVEYQFKLVKNGGEWKIKKKNAIHFNIDFPNDIEEVGKKVGSQQPIEAEKVLQDLNTYFTAKNNENYETTLQYTSPFFIQQRNNFKNPYLPDYEEVIKSNFENFTTTMELLDPKVLYIDNLHAYVHARILFSEEYKGEIEGPYEYEELIRMDKIDNGHWTYNTERDMNGDY